MHEPSVEASGNPGARLWKVLLFAAVAAALVAGTVVPGDCGAENEARRIFATIMSPYCPGQMLTDCTSPQAAALRDTIKAQLARGRSPQEIKEELVAVFGPEVLALPPNRGIGLIAWIGPIAAMTASLLIAIWWIRQRHARPEPDTPEEISGQLGPQEAADRSRLRQRLRDELDRRD